MFSISYKTKKIYEIIYSISENLGAVFSEAYESVGKRIEEFTEECTGFKISVDIRKGSM